jgi:hypothetical protein
MRLTATLLDSARCVGATSPSYGKTRTAPRASWLGVPVVFICPFEKAEPSSAKCQWRTTKSRWLWDARGGQNFRTRKNGRNALIGNRVARSCGGRQDELPHKLSDTRAIRSMDSRRARHLTPSRRSANNDTVLRTIVPVTVGLLITPFLLFGSVCAPLHVHERAVSHAHALVHSHFESHQFQSHQRGAEFEGDAEHIIWLENAVLYQTTYHADSAPALAGFSLGAVPDVPSWSATPFDHKAPAHGPPRRHPSFRGPPLLLA